MPLALCRMALTCGFASEHVTNPAGAAERRYGGKSARGECQRWPVGSPAWLIQGLTSQPTQCTWQAWIRDPLSRRHTLTVARRRHMWSDVPSSCTDTGWKWPGAAQYLSPLAPQLAPRNPANVHLDTSKCRAVGWRGLSFDGQLRYLGTKLVT